MANVLQYVEDDATCPIGAGKKILAHICNTAGGWGRGFVVALSKRWKLPEISYRSLRMPITMGIVQFVHVTDKITVANMVAQSAPRAVGSPPINYGGLREALKKVAKRALEEDRTVHMPKIGTGLSRGNWDTIKQIIQEELLDRGVPVFIYIHHKTSNRKFGCQ